MTVSLTYLEGDEATFSTVYACFVAIKYHIKTLKRAVMDAFNLGDDDIEQTLFHHRLSTIYSEAHGFAFATNPMFTDMRSKITTKFDENFLQVGKGSINQQAKAALVRLSNGNEDLRQSYFSEFATFIMRPRDSDYDLTISSLSHQNCGRCVTIHATTPSRVYYRHCTRTQPVQVGVSAITRRASTFIVAHTFGWAKPRSRRALPSYSM